MSADAGLRLLAYNVLQPPLLSWPRALVRAARAYEVIVAADPDVVVLCEAFSGTPAARLVRRLRQAGYHATPQVGSRRGRSAWTSRSAGRGTRTGGVVGGGVVVLSRTPILQQHEHVFAATQPGTEDDWCDKGVALVQVAHPAGPIWVAGTHLQADEPGTPVAATREVRQRQLAEIRDAVGAVVPADQPVLVAGDLNVEYYATDERGRPAGVGTAWQQADAALGGRIEPDGPIHDFTFDGARNPLTGAAYRSYRNVLDYVGRLDGGRPLPRISTTTLVSAGDASDHFPVLAEVHRQV
ncbi:endonuclease/exonuclease/phosphatase family protein [Pseudonocardia sp. CA-107938]|uniref:endonuclease/exonuclease/phosphatase family protein n=1 Tax=Pseudonocardia sp. CA-107938 TaxID=3240021 RepID=UPI003D8D5986